MARNRTSSRVRRAVMGGGSLAALAALAAATVRVANNRYLTGKSTVRKSLDITGGTIIVLSDGQIFVTTAGSRQRLAAMVIKSGGTSNYCIDRFRRHPSGLPYGMVAAEQQAATKPAQ